MCETPCISNKRASRFQKRIWNLQILKKKPVRSTVRLQNRSPVCQPIKTHTRKCPTVCQTTRRPNNFIENETLDKATPQINDIEEKCADSVSLKCLVYVFDILVFGKVANATIILLMNKRKDICFCQIENKLLFNNYRLKNHILAI